MTLRLLPFAVLAFVLTQTVHAKPKVTVTEFFDFQCEYCAKSVDVLDQVRKTYPRSQVEIIYKHLPLQSIHPLAAEAAVASECIREQGQDKFLKFYKKVFANQGKLDTLAYAQYATDAGVNAKKYTACLKTDRPSKRVQSDLNEAKERSLKTIPTFIVGDEVVVGSVPFEQLNAVIQAQLHKK